MPVEYSEISIHRSVIIDVSGAAGTRSLPTALEEGFSVVGTPAFPLFLNDNIELPHAVGFVRAVRGTIPIQELTFTMNTSNEGLWRAARRPYQRIGAAIATLVAGEPQIRFRDIIQQSATRRLRVVERVYRGAVDPPLPSYSDNGITTYDIAMRDVLYAREAETDWMPANGNLPDSFENEDPAANPDLIFLADKLTDRLIVNGVDEKQGILNLLGLAVS